MSFNRRGESGNVFFTLFGAVALVGVIGVATTTLMKGPVGTVVSLNQKAKVESQLQIARKLVALDSAQSTADCDGDGTIEATAPDVTLPGCATLLTGGGCLPTTVGAARLDPWGTLVGYCGWDHDTHGGGDNSGTLCPGNPLLSGENGSASGVVLAVISAGPNRSFESSCGNAPAYVTKPNGSDDIVFEWTYEEAAEGLGGGLWSLVSGDGDSITTDKNIEVESNATFNSGVTFSGGSTAAFNSGSMLDLSAGGLFNLPTQNSPGMSACNAGNDQMLRINTGMMGDLRVLQICDNAVAGDWVDIGGSGASTSVHGNDGDIQFNSGDALWSDSAFSWDVANHRLLIGSPATADDTVEIEGSVGISNDLNVHGVVEVDAGGASNPAFTFTSAGDTGMYLDAGDVGISVSGTERLLVTTTGAAVTGDLATTGDASIGDMLFVSNSARITNNVDVGGVLFSSAGNLTIDDTLSVTGPAIFNSNGYFTGGLNANGFYLDGSVAGSTITDGDDGIATDGAGGLGLMTAGTRRIHIDSAGDVGIGVAGSPTATLDINGMLRLRNNSTIEAGDACTAQDGSIVYGSGDRLLLCSSMTGFWETIGATGGGGGGTVGLWHRNNGALQPIEGHGIDDFAVGNTTPGTAGTYLYFDKSDAAFRVGTATGAQWGTLGNSSVAMGSDVNAGGIASFALGNEANVVTGANYSGVIGLGNPAGIAPQVSATGSLGIFMGDQSGVNLNMSNVMLLAGGSLVIDPDPTSATAITPNNDLALDVQGSIGAMNFCNEEGTECFTVDDILTGATGAPGYNREIIYNSNGDLATDPRLVFSSAGGLGLNATAMGTRLDVGGTIRMGYEGEACDLSREGSIQYDSSADTFYVCRTAGQPWQALAAGAASAGGPNRSIQFNSGGLLAGDVNYVLTPAGYLGLGVAAPTQPLHVRNGSPNLFLDLQGPSGSANVGLGTGGVGRAGMGWELATNNLILGVDETATGTGGFLIRVGSVYKFGMDNAGRVGIGDNYTPNTQLDVQGTMRMAYDGEACDLSREGAIHYNSANDNFYVCKTNGAGWQMLSAGSSVGAGGNDRELQFNSGGQLAGIAGYNYDLSGRLMYTRTETATAAGSYIQSGQYITLNPAANQDPATVIVGNSGFVHIPSTNNFNKSNVRALVGQVFNEGGGNVGGIGAGYVQAYNSGAVTGGYLSGLYSSVVSSAGVLNAVTGLESDSTVSGGTVASVFGLSLGSNITGSAVTNRYGIYLETPVGVASSDWAIYQQGNQPSRLGGRLRIGAAGDPMTQLDVVGTIKMSYGAESCDFAREGSIHYNSSNDTFYACRTAGAWTPLATGTPAAAAPVRGIQFNSGGSFEADSLLTFTTNGQLDVGGGLILSGDNSPAQINGPTNDFNPANLATTSVLRLTTDASRQLTGIAGGTDGRVLTLLNVGVNPLVLGNENAGSTAANRFLIGANMTLAANQSVTLIYDAGSSRWRPISSVSAGGSGGEVRFTSLLDAPASYSGQSLRLVRVNSAETGVEFTNNIIESIGGVLPPVGMNLDDLADVTSTAPTVGQVLMYSGGNWIAGSASGSATAAGASRELQFNSGGAFAADPLLSFSSSGQFSIGGGLILSGDNSPAQITATTNDYNPANLASTSILRLTTDASRQLTGIVGGADGRVLTVMNVGTNALVLRNDNAGSAAGNRFLIGADMTLAANQSVTFVYDAGSSRWRPMSSVSAGGSSGAIAFTSLTDVPASYTGQALRILRVNSGATGVEFTNNIVESISGIPVPTGYNLNDLADVNTPTPTNGQVLLYSAGNWIAGTASGSSTAAGASRQLQFNSGGALAADALLSFSTTGQFSIGGGLILSGDNSPAQITATTNDYNPANLATTSILRLTTDASRQLTGIAGGADGRVLTVMNVGTNALVLRNDNTGSTAANRFLIGSDMTLAANQSVTFVYDSGSSRWRPMSSVSAGGSGGTIAFTSLTDAPATYTGQALKLVRVNSAATGVEFTDSIIETVGGVLPPVTLNLDDLSDVNATLPTNGQVLMYSGSAWVAGAGGGGTPGGATRQIQFNSSGSFAGNTNFVYTATGRVGIGNAAPTEMLDVTGTIRASEGVLLGQVTGAAAPNIMSLDDLSNVNVPSPTNGQVLMYSAGSWGVGTSLSLTGLSVTGDITYTGTLTDISDMRMKANIHPLRDQGSMLEKIGMIDTYSYYMKNDLKRLEYGVMAQELEKIFPALVHTADDEMSTKSVNYMGLVAPMIEATKELKAENESLRAEVASLRAERDEMTIALNNLATDVKGLKAHTGYGIGRAEIGIWMLLAALASCSIVLVAGVFLGKRRHKA